MYHIFVLHHHFYIDHTRYAALAPAPLSQVSSIRELAGRTVGESWISMTRTVSSWGLDGARQVAYNMFLTGMKEPENPKLSARLCDIESDVYVHNHMIEASIGPPWGWGCEWWRPSIEEYASIERG